MAKSHWLYIQNRERVCLFYTCAKQNLSYYCIIDTTVAILFVMSSELKCIFLLANFGVHFWRYLRKSCCMYDARSCSFVCCCNTPSFIVCKYINSSVFVFRYQKLASSPQNELQGKEIKQPIFLKIFIVFFMIDCYCICHLGNLLCLWWSSSISGSPTCCLVNCPIGSKYCHCWTEWNHCSSSFSCSCCTFSAFCCSCRCCSSQLVI